MALTSHFLSRDNSGHLRLDNRLLAFRVVDGKHDGKSIAKITFDILKEANLLGKVSGCRPQYILRNSILYATSYLTFTDWPIHSGQCSKLQYSDGMAGVLFDGGRNCV